jgi:hypothetical protein
MALQVVIAARAEFHGEYIALLDSTGKLAALFLMEMVESWSVLGSYGEQPPDRNRWKTSSPTGSYPL